MKHYCEEVASVLQHVASGENGLTAQEAEKRLVANGKNKLAEGKKDSLLKRFVDQLMDPMIIILLAAAAISGVLAVNYAFMFPYYAIDLITPVNMATAVVMLIVLIMTSTLTTQISIQQEVKAAAECERMRANLLRAIFHDLRTPLTSISGACSVILDNHDTLSKEKQLTLLSDMRRDADWLIRMVENLLSVTRIDEKKMMVSKTPTVLEELIDTVLVKFYKHYPDQQVEAGIPEEFVSIPMDAILIEQVLINLMENAVVHAKGMTRLCLTVTVENGKACFCVSDDGCGIPAHRLNDLFTGYLDRDQAVSDGQRTGMGIGLFVCAAIVRAHGSEISACNQPEGGAAFRFALDMEEDNDKYRILAVEDDCSVSSLLYAMLDAQHYETLMAETCARGLMMLTSHVPDLVILDLGLPDRDELDFIRIARQKSTVPILVLSARSTEKDKVTALDMGANDYITKPFSTAELLARVRAALRYSRPTTQSKLPESRFQLHDLTIEYESRTVMVDSQPIHLTQTEYNILALLAQHAGKLLTYIAMNEAIWGADDPGGNKKLQVNMANLRRKLGIRPGDNRYIVNELGVGYRMLQDEAEAEK